MEHLVLYPSLSVVIVAKIKRRMSFLSPMGSSRARGRWDAHGRCGAGRRGRSRITVGVGGADGLCAGAVCVADAADEEEGPAARRA